VVLAIGNPFGVGQTVTHGIVSALARTQVGISDYRFFIQTDAAINPGNSGGALVDLTGKLIGINTAIFSRSGGSQGVGFAIPANMVRVVVASAKTGGSAVVRPWLGAKLQAVTPEIADSMGLKRPAGALVSNVTADSPAASAGMLSITGSAQSRWAAAPVWESCAEGVSRRQPCPCAARPRHRAMRSLSAPVHLFPG
jgi:S1-C subfamily serine protease